MIREITSFWFFNKKENIINNLKKLEYFTFMDRPLIQKSLFHLRSNFKGVLAVSWLFKKHSVVFQPVQKPKKGSGKLRSPNTIFSFRLLLPMYWMLNLSSFAFTSPEGRNVSFTNCPAYKFCFLKVTFVRNTTPRFTTLLFFALLFSFILDKSQI